MSEAAPFMFGTVVTCEDGECGELQRVVVDSYGQTVTHLVVEPGDRTSKGRMVPVELLAAASTSGIRLRCTLAHFALMDDAETTDVRTASTVDVESQWAEVRSMERFSSGHVDLGMGLRPDRRLVADENIGEGQGEIWQGQHVHASDGPIGRVRGVVADAETRRLTEVLLEEGHLWGEKEVAIPASAVKYVFDDGVHLTLTKKEVGGLPAVGSAG